MELLLPCPNCGWQNLMRKDMKYTPNNLIQKHELATGARCLKCNWEGEFVFAVDIKTKRQGEEQ